MVAMRASCSGESVPNKSTPSSAITFSTMFNSATFPSRPSSSQPRRGRARDLHNFLGAVRGGLVNFGREIPHPLLGGGGHRARDQPRVARVDQFADGVFGR